MVFGLHSVPLIAMLAVIAATIARGIAVRRATGDRPWAFVSARGLQRAAGASFAVSAAVLIAAAASAKPAGALWFTILAAILATGGAAAVIVAQVQMGRAWRVGVRAGDAPLFVAHGLFRFSRNPIFAGMIAVGFAAALVCATWWGWAGWAVFVTACTIQVRIEEAHMEASFGDTYRDFRAAVPRWIGWGARQ